MVEEDYEKSLNQPVPVPVVPAPRTSLIPKDISRQSMCSLDSDAKTDFTDLSPATPQSNFQPLNSFVASFPYNEQSQEAHRRQTKNLQEIFLAPDAPYETIKDSNQYESTPLTLNYELSSSSSSSSGYSNSNSSNNINYPAVQANSPKSVSVTPLKRQNMGTNISQIIHNLKGSSDFLYQAESPSKRNNIDPNNLLINSNTTKTLSANSKQDCNNIINSNLSEKQREWSELNNDRRL
jgi:hypothetical protein